MFKIITMKNVHVTYITHCNVNVRLILKNKGGKQHSSSFVGSNLGVEIFLKKRELQKRMR